MRRIVAVSIGLVLLLGCGGGRQAATLSGTIKYKGQAVNGATLLFCTATGNGSDGIPIITGQDGAFTSANIPPGDYKVVIQGRAGDPGMPSLKGMPPEKAAEAKQKLDKMGSSPPTIEFPTKYTQFTTTDLKYTVTAGKMTLDIELKD
jgi:hypothetical protein